jgi:hypothetical protein
VVDEAGPHRQNSSRTDGPISERSVSNADEDEESEWEWETDEDVPRQAEAEAEAGEGTPVEADSGQMEEEATKRSDSNCREWKWLNAGCTHINCTNIYTLTFLPPNEDYSINYQLIFL